MGHALSVCTTGVRRQKRVSVVVALRALFGSSMLLALRAAIAAVRVRYMKHGFISAVISTGGLGQRHPGRSCDLLTRDADLQLVHNFIAALRLQGLVHFRHFHVTPESSGA